MKQNVSNAPVATFQVHPEVMKTYREKDLESLRFTIARYGQQTPVKVVERDGQMYIIDGVSRFNCAKQLSLPSLIYEMVTVEDNKVMEYRLLSNVKTKRTFTEMCFEVEYVLDIMGTSQGKKRDLMGFDDFLNDKNYGEVGKDRYELVAALLGIDMRSSSLRKAMKVFWSDFNPKGQSEAGIIEKLDAGEISIDKAHKLVCDRDRKKREKEDTERIKLSIRNSNFDGKDKPYKLYCKSCAKMNEVPNDTIDLIIDSHPYWQQREYRNQDDLKHGQETTIQEYLENFKAFNEEKFLKLKPGGVLVTIIGETYKGGYQGVCTRAEIKLEEIGFTVIDVLPWVKTNQKYAPHPLRFQNTYERIIVACKRGAAPYFKPVMKQGSVDVHKVKKTKRGGLYIASPETCITNVITTPVFNPKSLKEIDPDFQHDAPCPPEVYQIFIEAYSKPGDTILDGFMGSGTAGVALQLGRKVIGYDVDPLSIEFAQKRFEWYLKQGQQEVQNDDENTHSIAA